MRIERRTFLSGSAAVAGGVFAGGPFQGFVAQQAVADPKGDAPFRSPYDAMAQGGTTSVEVTRFGEVVDAFSLDGHTMFVNIQAGRGMTFAIWGPWQRIGV